MRPFGKAYKFLEIENGEQTSLYVELQAQRIEDKKLLTAYKTNRKFCENLPQFPLLQKEIQILGSLSHRYIQDYVDTIFDGEIMYILLGFQKYPFFYIYRNCQYLYEDNKNKDQLNAKIIFYHLFQAIDYIHEKGIAHRDICPESIFFDAHFNIKLGHFFHAIYLDKDERCPPGGGCINFQAPETFSEEKYNGKKADIWSAGVLLLSAMIRNNYFTGDTADEIIQNIKTQPIQYPNYFSEQLINLLNLMIQRDPNERKSIHEILRCEWFQSILENNENAENV